jgi:type IV secretion system protein VirB10
VNIFRRPPTEGPAAPDEREASAPGTGDSPALKEPIVGDRGIPSINRARSIQSRVSSVLAIALMSVLGLGFLTWYYAKALTRPRQAAHAAQLAVKNRAQGEMALPPLGPIRSPLVPREATTTPAPVSDSATAERLLGPPPELRVTVAPTGLYPTGAPPTGAATTPPKSPGQLAFERRLAGPAFARVSRDQSQDLQSAAGAQGPDAGVLAVGHTPRTSGEDVGTPPKGLDALLRPSVTPAVAAAVLPTRRFLLAKGAFIDCTLETAIDSTLPGMTTCITATDTFSADGSVVLLERGTKLVGETRGQVQQGAARVFVLWTEARTPTGVVVPLASPGTDELGRSGLPGEVNRHFWDRFGAAILLTVVNGGVEGAVNSQNQAGSVVVSPSTSTDVMTDVLRGTVDIPPTVTKAQGDRIQVFVARDVDFRSVYALRVANEASAPGKTP